MQDRNDKTAGDCTNHRIDFKEMEYCTVRYQEEQMVYQFLF